MHGRRVAPFGPGPSSKKGLIVLMETDLLTVDVDGWSAVAIDLAFVASGLSVGVGIDWASVNFVVVPEYIVDSQAQYG